MTIESILAFSLAMLILAASPGPGVFASIAQALSSGFRSSLDVIVGIILGDILFLMLAIFGLSAVALVLGEFFFIVKIAGGLYLIYLGWKMWTAKPVPFEETRRQKNSTRKGRFMGGLLITLGNPKVIVFYAGFLPNFMDLQALTLTDIIIVISLISLILICVLGLYSYFASRATRFFVSPRAVKNLNRCAGTVMAGAGVAIATR